MFKLELASSQYKLLSRYCADLSKALLIASVIGFVLPSALPSAIVPTPDKALAGGIGALTLLVFAVKFAEGGGK